MSAVPPNYPNPWQTPVQSGKAVASLVLGILSIMCCAGPVTGIPAIVFGFLARKDVAKSDGQMDGSGLAVAGIVTGMIGTFGSLVYAVVYASTLLMVGASPAMGPYTPPTTSAYYTPPSVVPSTGKIHVLQLRAADGPLPKQLAKQAGDALVKGDRLMVMTVSAGCAACAEILGTFSDFEMQMSLDHVTVVKVDVDEFAKELGGAGLDKGKNLPWFFLLDSTGRVTDAVSADEWDDNRPENIAPVMDDLLDGTHKKHKKTPAFEDPF